MKDSPERDSMVEEIMKTLILSRYEAETCGELGKTTEDIQNFEQLAIDKYLGKVWDADNPFKIRLNTFRASVKRDTALIMNAIDNYLALRERYERNQIQSHKGQANPDRQDLLKSCL